MNEIEELKISDPMKQVLKAHQRLMNLFHENRKQEMLEFEALLEN